MELASRHRVSGLCAMLLLGLTKTELPHVCTPSGSCAASVFDRSGTVGSEAVQHSAAVQREPAHDVEALMVSRVKNGVEESWAAQMESRARGRRLYGEEMRPASDARPLNSPEPTKHVACEQVAGVVYVVAILSGLLSTNEEDAKDFTASLWSGLWSTGKRMAFAFADSALGSANAACRSKNVLTILVTERMLLLRPDGMALLTSVLARLEPKPVQPR